jgi:hypothetical protein
VETVAVYVFAERGVSVPIDTGVTVVLVPVVLVVPVAVVLVPAVDEVVEDMVDEVGEVAVAAGVSGVGVVVELWRGTCTDLMMIVAIPGP